MAENKNIEVGGRLHSIATGNVLAGADEILDDSKNKKQSDINTETYSLVNDVNERLNGLSPDQQSALNVATKATNNETKLGYYVCGTDGNVAAKVISDATGYVLSKGGSIKIKMTNANTANNATLNINSTGAKALYYNGERASAINSWEAGETVEVYYDGTSFYANSVAGGSGDGAFDISAKTGNTYETLSAALTAANSILSAGKKKGGMSIKFIQLTPASYTVVRTEGVETQPTGTELQEALILESGTYTAAQMTGVTLPESGSVTYYLAVTEIVDEQEVITYNTWVITKATNDIQKYVQYRLMATDWSTGVNNWQGVDSEPVDRSKNFVESGGILSSSKKQVSDGLLKMFGREIITDFTPSGIDVSGSVANINTSVASTSNTLKAIFNCKEGDIIYIGNAVRSANTKCRIYAFLGEVNSDGTYPILLASSATISERTNYKVVAPAGTTKCILQTRSTSDYFFYKLDKLYDKIGDISFDVSAYNATGTVLQLYANLAAALNEIPAAMKKGGMSIKYLEGTSENKSYVHYVNITENYSSNVNNWVKIEQTEVDNTIIEGSENPVSGGAVFNAIQDINDANYIKTYININNIENCSIVANRWVNSMGNSGTGNGWALIILEQYGHTLFPVKAGSTISVNEGYQYSYVIKDVDSRTSGNVLKREQYKTTSVRINVDGYLMISVASLNPDTTTPLTDEEAIQLAINSITIKLLTTIKSTYADIYPTNQRVSMLENFKEEAEQSIQDIDESIVEINDNLNTVDNKFYLNVVNASSYGVVANHWVNSQAKSGTGPGWALGILDRYGYTLYPVKKGSTITPVEGYKFSYTVKADDSRTAAGRLEIAQNVTSQVTIAHDGYLMFSVTKVGNDDVTGITIEEALEYLKDGVVVNLNTSIENTSILDKKIEDNTKRITTLENPIIHWTSTKNLPFYYGYVNSAGTYVYELTNSRIVLPKYIKVKAGSKISWDSTIKVQIFELFDDETYNYTGYAKGGSYVFQRDCNIKIGIEAVDTTYPINFSVLEHLTIDLICEKEQPNRFDKREFINFYNIPTDIYRGLHVDDSGLTQETMDYNAFIALFDSLVDNDYVTKKDLGVTYIQNEGQENEVQYHIYKYTLSVRYNAPNKVKPRVFIDTNVHGHEKSSTLGVYYLLKDIVEHYNDSPVLNYLRNNITLEIIPAVNVYGIMHNDRRNHNGVNINRNWNTFSWADYDDRAGEWEYNSKGTAPFSEQETKYIAKELLSSNATTLAIDIHTNGTDTIADQLVWSEYQYSYLGNYDFNVRDILSNYHAAMRGVIDSYEPGLTASTIAGLLHKNDTKPSIGTWLFESTNIIGGTFEVPCGSTTGAVGPKLSKYSPDTIKLCGELIGNYIMFMLRGLANPL